MSDNNTTLLRAILATIGRQTFNLDRLADVVMSKGAGPKQVKAYNLCDGTLTQGEIAKALKLDTGNFSRTVSRWVSEGVVFKLGEGREARLLHLYSLPEGIGKKGK